MFIANLRHLFCCGTTQPCDGSSSGLPTVIPHSLPVRSITADSIRSAATLVVQEAQLFSVALCCLGDRVVLALKPALPPGTEQDDWRPYLVDVFLQ